MNARGKGHTTTQRDKDMGGAVGRRSREKRKTKKKKKKKKRKDRKKKGEK